MHSDTAESSEGIPLTPKQKLFKINNGYDIAVDEAEKHLLKVPSNSRKIKPEIKNKRNVSLIDSSAAYPVTNLHDINAMSVASIYDREDDDVMDADK